MGGWGVGWEGAYLQLDFLRERKGCLDCCRGRREGRGGHPTPSSSSSFSRRRRRRTRWVGGWVEGVEEGELQLSLGGADVLYVVFRGVGGRGEEGGWVVGPCLVDLEDFDDLGGVGG